MVFSSLNFIFWFMPTFLISYFCVSRRYRNVVLLIYSLCFYAYGCIKNPIYFIVFLISILINFNVARIISRINNKNRKFYFVVAIIFNILILVISKYRLFFIQVINDIFYVLDMNLIKTTDNFILPLGVSFYVFQSISYLIDVYYNKYKAENDIIIYSTYITMFPQLVAGPIVRFDQISWDIRARLTSNKKIVDGFVIFSFGLAFKVLIANNLNAIMVNIDKIGYDSITTFLAWIGMYSFTFQIYFDFFGYSLMAIGLGEMLGFKIPENFKHPFLARSVSEFWRRWHITLTTWFRDYVYIPLGGNKEGILSTIINILIVWILTGFWHGADYNFLLWGLVLGIIIIFEKYIFGIFLSKNKIFSHFYVLLIIPMTFLIFYIKDIENIPLYFLRLFNMGASSYVYPFDFVDVLKNYLFILLLSICLLTEYPYKLYNIIYQKKPNIVICFAIILFLISVFFIFRGLDNPFIYFRF